MTNILASDKAILERLLVSRAERDADVAEAKFGTADEIEERRRITWRETQAKQHTTPFRSPHEWDDTTPHAESQAEWLARHGFESPAREVTKLPEVHDHAGDDLPFHIPAGRATQVLGSREIDISRIPDSQNVTVTDSNGRALPTRSALARETAIIKALTGNEALAKLARKYGAKHMSFTMSR